MSRLTSDLSPGTYVLNPDTPSSTSERPWKTGLSVLAVSVRDRLGVLPCGAFGVQQLLLEPDSATAAPVAGPIPDLHSPGRRGHGRVGSAAGCRYSTRSSAVNVRSSTSTLAQ